MLMTTTAKIDELIVGLHAFAYFRLRIVFGKGKLR
jgi:hypothetical protein